MNAETLCLNFLVAQPLWRAVGRVRQRSAAICWRVLAAPPLSLWLTLPARGIPVNWGFIRGEGTTRKILTVFFKKF